MRLLLNVVLATGMLVVIPAGLRLIAVPVAMRRWWWAGALPGAVSLWLPPGPPAAALAALYLPATAALALLAPRAWARARSLPLGLAAATALATPSIAAVALVAERAGRTLWGFEPPILALTVAHFHYAGFAAALVAGLVARAAGPGAAARLAALSVPAGTLMVLGGYFVAEWAELAGALVLTAGMWTVAWLTFTEVRSGAPGRATRALLAVSAVVLAASMPLALSWAVGEATGLPKPSIAWMTATHGVLNAFGFALCALAAWLRLRPIPL
ncbi:hypothetical protein HNP84_004823 [Thermocatellispora tengchongensis]|uniref:YndJ-like protein n=1 Tax=Thermocatellispora tengchongensis TaxID=1073253 RepID=A0A840PD46_9ACTN|nr:YndJ family transporter [Thermocatellispora tengchongensis]MBB5135087.1 hypothetical protein [Thermocatellispora tengchongensis]